jgi:hypothetical protein
VRWLFNGMVRQWLLGEKMDRLVGISGLVVGIMDWKTEIYMVVIYGKRDVFFIGIVVFVVGFWNFWG